MSQKVANANNPPPDLFGVGHCSRSVNRDTSTTRVYIREMFAESVAGVHRVSNGDYVLTPAALAELDRRIAARGRG